jgi:serine/threonine-protein kinase
MATVWTADDPVLSRRVAVKILRPDLAENQATRTRFRQEAIAAAKVSHPNIVSTYDTGDDDGVAYIVMELIDGPTLRDLIDTSGGLPVGEVVRIGAQVANALSAAHRAGLIHRDVKPANVLVPKSGPVKVTDFGIAKAVGTNDGLTRTGTVMGTARYLAPEQVNGQATDPRTDVYALGLLLYEALCGHPPFGGDTDIATAMARLTTSVPAVRDVRPEVSVALDDVIHRCLARDPAARFGSAAAVRDALERVARDPSAALPRPTSPATGGSPTGQTTGAHPRPSSAPGPAPRKRRTGSWLWIALLLFVAAAGGVVAFLLVSAAGNDPPGVSSPSAAPSRPPAFATAFDPLGDGTEDDAQAANVVDGSPNTSWSTEYYPTFPYGPKDGVGISLDFGTEYKVNKVIIEALRQGWGASIYLSDRPAASMRALADWGPSRASGSDLPLQWIAETRGRTARSILVWLTQLPAGPNGHAVEIAEVKVE